MHDACKAFSQPAHKPIAVKGRDIGSSRYRDNPFHFAVLKTPEKKAFEPIV
jgi:hypothetical protein